MLNKVKDLVPGYYAYALGMDSYCCDLHGVTDEELDELYNLLWKLGPTSLGWNAFNCAMAQKMLSLTGALESF